MLRAAARAMRECEATSCPIRTRASWTSFSRFHEGSTACGAPPPTSALDCVEKALRCMRTRARSSGGSPRPKRWVRRSLAPNARKRSSRSPTDRPTLAGRFRNCSASRTRSSPKQSCFPRASSPAFSKLTRVNARLCSNGSSRLSCTSRSNNHSANSDARLNVTSKPQKRNSARPSSGPSRRHRSAMSSACRRSPIPGISPRRVSSVPGLLARSSRIPPKPPLAKPCASWT